MDDALKILLMSRQSVFHWVLVYMDLCTLILGSPGHLWPLNEDAWLHTWSCDKVFKLLSTEGLYWVSWIDSGYIDVIYIARLHQFKSESSVFYKSYKKVLVMSIIYLSHGPCSNGHRKSIGGLLANTTLKLMPWCIHTCLVLLLL